MADITVTDHGSIWLFRPLTEAAQEVFAEYIAEDAQWFGGALAVEARYAFGLAFDLEADHGLTLEVN